MANINGIISLAREIRDEFHSKAVGTTLNWIPVLVNKLPSPASLGVVYVAPACYGVAARAATILPLEPTKVVEIVKDKLSWHRDCRRVDVYKTYSDNNGGIIELINTQYYAPTTMACARDFWTLRYTSLLDDGDFVVCEKSIGTDVVLSSPVALEFVRTKILSSGYLIRPCAVGSTIYVVDHLDLEASSVPEIIRPLYLSSPLIIRRMIVPVLQYVEHVATESTKKQTHANECPTFHRSFGQRLTRGFNDAVNGFDEDGWRLMNADAADNVYVSIKHSVNEVNGNHDSVVCVKTSLLLQHILPAKLVKLLKERRASWINFRLSTYSALLSRGPEIAFPGSDTHELSETTVVLGETNYQDEVVEVIRFESLANNASSRDLYQLQITNGMEDTDFGDCSELIFAPIAKNLPNDAVLLSSGFRVFHLGTNTVTHPSVNLGFSEVHASAGHPCLLVLAFQFPFKTHLQEKAVAMAKEYVQNVISSVRNFSLEMRPSTSGPAVNHAEENAPTGLNWRVDYRCKSC